MLAHFSKKISVLGFLIFLDYAMMSFLKLKPEFKFYSYLFLTQILRVLDLNFEPPYLDPRTFFNKKKKYESHYLLDSVIYSIFKQF